uniref:Uncharacterized protein n=1 Tax=Ditylenchus dipsaci TaxID=166011 RepID=A0A915E4H4_9BILA
MEQLTNKRKYFSSFVLGLLTRMRQASVHMALVRRGVDKNMFKEDLHEEALMITSNKENQSADDILEAEIYSKLGQEEQESWEKIFDTQFVSGKVRVLLELIRKAMEGNDKCVVVSQWTSVLSIVAIQLKKVGIRCAKVTGEENARQRSSNSSFVANSRWCWAKPDRGNHLFLMDLHWNPALENQACDRIHRIGQQKDVYIYKLVCEGSVEEGVYELQKSKLNLAHSILSSDVRKGSGLKPDDYSILFRFISSRDPKTQMPENA